MSLRRRLGIVLVTSVLFVLDGSFSMCTADPAQKGALAPWASNVQKTDKARTHVEEVSKPTHQYSIVQGGTLDGENCRMPLLGCHAAKQVWESNRSVRLENIGKTDIVNPWLSNGRNDFRTMQEIVDSAIEPGMTDAEKAYALWYQETTHRYHFTTNDREVKNPVKVLNIYGYNTCGDDANCMAGLWRTAGFKVAPARLYGHCITQVFYDGSWHLLDGDEGCVYLLRDNKTVASEKALARDHDLIKRSHVRGILHYDSRDGDEREAAGFVYEGEAVGTRNAVGNHTMDMVLRPGEALTWRWGHTEPVKYHGYKPPMHKGPNLIGNGLWEYRPDLTRDLWQSGAATVENVRRTRDGLAAQAGKTATIVWTMSSPYVLVGGRLEAEGPGAKFALSWDGQKWEDIGTDLDKLFPPKGPARYKYHVRCTLVDDARLKSVAIVNDLQMAVLAMPGMAIGKNAFVYSDKTPGKRRVRITHAWVERSSSHPPKAPPAPVYPPDGGETDGTGFTFKWAAPEDADGDAIVDYHFELSDRADMKWPLSPTYSRVMSLMRNHSKRERWILPYPGMLTPDRQYYWHVRAKDDKGVWGPWSKTWTMTVRGVANPVGVKLNHDAARGVGTLTWKPNPVGSRPVTYRIYGSDEKGFTVSDKPYKVQVGSREPKLPTPFPANFVAETDKTELVVLGKGLELPNANRAYYRVVAVGKRDTRSWSSDYVEAPRPFITTKPALTARVGQAYSHQVSAIRSLGDLRYRSAGLSFWDIEKPAFTLEHAPDWLKFDADSGLLTGTPDKSGKTEVVLKVSIDNKVRQLDPRMLSWGREKVTGTRIEHVGAATQRFVIDVSK